MSQFVRIAWRDEETRSSFLTTLCMERRSRPDHHHIRRHRLGHESVVVVILYGGIDPHVDRGDVVRRRRRTEDTPRDVVAKAVNARHRLLYHRCDGTTRKATER